MLETQALLRCLFGVPVALGLILVAGHALAETTAGDVAWKSEEGRWNLARVKEWYAGQKWIVGANFVPSTASNQLEMWQAETFDPETIDRELGWAAAAGFNAMRVFLHDMAWEADPNGFEGRVEQYLAIAARHGIGTLLVPFDSVWDPYPEVGPQKEPVPHVHNSRWVQSPHIDIQKDPSRYDELKPYLTAILTRFKDDERVLGWDLLNEPGNPTPQYEEGWSREDKEKAHVILLTKLFAWAREVNPTQPLTAGVWAHIGNRTPVHPLNKLMIEQSDFITFHSYGKLPEVQAIVEWVQKSERPIVCTEYMSRGSGSTFETILPYFKEQHIGAMNWGLVSGRSQTIYPWDSWDRKYTEEPTPWFHDVFRKDGTPYDEKEVTLIRSLTGAAASANPPAMYYADSDHGAPFAKDPDVVRFKGRYLMYYTVRYPKRIGIGIAESGDLVEWRKIGEIDPAAAYEAKGLGAPAAIVHEGKVHLFYQTYGNGPKDAICHAVSEDGIQFERDATNPIFAPTGHWTVGRAIDAEVHIEGDTAFLYGATRDPEMKRQMVFVATAPVSGGFARESWSQRCDAPILAPELPWETRCIEAPSVIKHGNRFFMFYAGGYNNDPQQIGVAASEDGLAWRRLSKEPLLPNGLEGAWNHSESGHPGVFVDDDGETWLFFQGNSDDGKTWHLSKMKVAWGDGGLPYLIRVEDGHEYRLR